MADRLNPQRATITIVVNGVQFEARAGDTVASALLALGRRVLRVTDREKEPRGIFCGIGMCYDCLVVVDGVPNQRACMTAAREGMQVEIQEQ